MVSNWITATMRKMSAEWIANQQLRDGDYFDENDMLICGTCGEPRREMRELPAPTDEDPDAVDRFLTTRMCKCDRDAKEEEERQKQLAKDMERIKYLRGISLMDARYAAATFENFKQNEYNARNLKLCRRYAEGFSEMLGKNQGLLMWGNVGTGKSFAAACIANYLLQHKVPVVMTSFVKILEIIQKDKDEETNIINRLDRAKLVIFDDLGAERSTEYAIEKVYNIIDSRYRSGLPMILTTNLTLAEMKEETDIRYARIYDRVFEICYPMQFTGPSFRKRTASERFTAMQKFLEGDD